MTLARLISEAEGIVAKIQRRLPSELRGLAEKVPVIFYDWPTPEILQEEFDPDILGLFVGEPHSVEQGLGNGVPTHILLFVESIFDEAEGDWDIFREEVRLTYLHELGHYFGWDEDELETRGLG